MEQKHVFQLAFAAAGVGWALRAAYESWIESKRIELEIEKELRGMMVDGKDAGVTFSDFPFHLPEHLREVLMSAAHMNFGSEYFATFTENLSPSSRTILLSGTSELYHQKLAKALAAFYTNKGKGKVLLLDINDLCIKLSKRSTSDNVHGIMPGLIELFPMWKKTQLFSFWEKTRDTLRCRSSSWPFPEKALVRSLYKVLVTTSKSDAIVLYIRDVDSVLYKSRRMYSLLERMSRRRSGYLIILGSRILGPNSECRQVAKMLDRVFLYQIEIRPQEDDKSFDRWKPQLKREMELVRNKDNRVHIMEVLAKNDIVCHDLDSVSTADTVLLSDEIEEIVLLAVSHHLRNTNEPKFTNGILVISSESLSRGLNIFLQSN